MPVRSIYDALSCVVFTELYTTAAPIQKVKNRYQVTRFALIYTNVIMCTALTGLVGGIYGKLQNPDDFSAIFERFNPLAIFVGSLEVVMSIVACVVSNISLQIHKYEHIDLIDCLHKLDASLIKEFQVKMNYQKIYRKTVILVIAFTTYFMIVSFTALISFSKNDYFFTPLIGICYIIIYTTPAASSYAAMNFADLLRIRFRLFQKLLDPDYLNRKYKSEKIRLAKLVVLIQKFQDMFIIIKKVSVIYGVSLLIVHFHDFTMTTSQMYFIYWKSTDGTDNTRLFMQFFFWMLPIIWKTIFLPLYMHLMLMESEVCIPLLLRADEYFSSADAKAMIQTFTLWNRHKKTRISVAGFFDSNLALGFAVCSAVTSYLLVLIQFKMQEDAELH